MKDVQAAVFDNGGVEDEKARVVYGTSERTATVELWIPSAEKLYLAVREKYFLESTARQLGAVGTGL